MPWGPRLPGSPRWRLTTPALLHQTCTRAVCMCACVCWWWWLCAVPASHAHHHHHHACAVLVVHGNLGFGKGFECAGGKHSCSGQCCDSASTGALEGTVLHKQGPSLNLAGMKTPFPYQFWRAAMWQPAPRYVVDCSCSCVCGCAPGLSALHFTLDWMDWQWLLHNGCCWPLIGSYGVGVVGQRGSAIILAAQCL